MSNARASESDFAIAHGFLTRKQALKDMTPAEAEALLRVPPESTVVSIAAVRPRVDDAIVPIQRYKYVVVVRTNTGHPHFPTPVPADMIIGFAKTSHAATAIKRHWNSWVEPGCSPPATEEDLVRMKPQATVYRCGEWIMHAANPEREQLAAVKREKRKRIMQRKRAWMAERADMVRMRREGHDRKSPDADMLQAMSVNGAAWNTERKILRRDEHAQEADRDAEHSDDDDDAPGGVEESKADGMAVPDEEDAADESADGTHPPVNPLSAWEFPASLRVPGQDIAIIAYERDTDVVDPAVTDDETVKGKEPFEMYLGAFAKGEEKQVSATLDALVAKYPDLHILDADMYKVGLVDYINTAFLRERKVMNEHINKIERGLHDKPEVTEEVLELEKEMERRRDIPFDDADISDLLLGAYAESDPTPK